MRDIAGRAWPPYVPSEVGPEAALAFVLEWLDTGPSDDMISRSALTQMEPLVDWHWETIGADLLQLMRSRPDLRLAVRGSMFDVPRPVADALHRAAEG
jgi:hypothetical protein